jgi:hypothetical protein
MQPVWQTGLSNSRGSNGDTRLDVFNNSSGYEGRQATFYVSGYGISVIGMGGCDVSIFRDPSVRQKP